MSFNYCFFGFWALVALSFVVLPIARRTWWLYCRRRLLKCKALCKMTRWEKILWWYFDRCECNRMRRILAQQPFEI